MSESMDDLPPEVPEISITDIKKKAVKGVAVLTGRTFFLNIVSLAATGLLTYYLLPSEFGVFWIVSSVVSFLAYFSDVGLAAALIQKKENVTEEELRTTFTIQQLIVLILLFVLHLLTPLARSYYNLTDQGVMLIYALGLSLLFASLKTIPSVLLERDLNFTKLVIPQVLENVFYNVSCVYFAWKGYGINSFTYAVIIRAFIGLIAMYIASPWVPGIAFSLKALKRLLTFGLPYQMNTFLAVFKDDGMTAFLGGILGASGMGFLGWAQKWAYTPLRLFMDHVLKVTFPAFSRIQGEKDHLKNALSQSVFFICILVFPMSVGLFILAPFVIELIPRYGKWSPALIPLTLISINTLFAASTTQFTNYLNAVGKIKTTFKLMVMWTILTWLFIPFLAFRWGVNGASLGYAMVGASSIVVYFIIRREISFDIWQVVLKPLIATSLMGLFLVLIKGFLNPSIINAGILVAAGFLLYASVIYLFYKEKVFTDIKKILNAY